MEVFQSPMGISTISKHTAATAGSINGEFQSPMGISTISKVGGIRRGRRGGVSIPNGDKHDFKIHDLAGVCQEY